MKCDLENFLDGGLILVNPGVLGVLVLNDPLGEPAGREQLLE